MESRTGLAAQPHPQRDGGASKSGRDKVSHQVRMYLHSAGANGTRPECGTSREYRKLASEGLTGDTATAGTLGIGDNPDYTETMENVEMEIGEPHRQRAPPVQGQTEEEGGYPLNGSARFTCKSRRKRRGGDPCPATNATRAHPGDGGVYPGPTACSPSTQLAGGGGGAKP